MTLVSCIVPVFNGERYLRETLDSIAAQTHRAIEIIVVDDGSTDGSLDVAGGHPHPIVCLHQANAGHASARNLGIASAAGDFLAFCDADDLWHPEKLARQLARFGECPELGVIFTHVENFRSGGEAVDVVAGYSSVTMLARREAFDRVGMLDVTLRHGNDRDWFCRAAEHGIAMEMMPDVLVRRRLHETNRSAALSADSRAEYLRILKASLDRRRSSGAVTAYPFHK
jgi:glycosyltransferase involved in cell wall biosynthesis